MGEPVWDILRKDPEWKQAFDDNMTFRNKVYSLAWHQKYPVKERLSERNKTTKASARNVIVDIGGNQGVDLQRFAETHPDLPCELILQDLPETLKGIREPLAPSITLNAYDFFTEQPVKGE